MAKWGTRVYHASDCSEQNHSIVLVHFNDVHRRERQYFKYPHTLVKDLLQCEHKHVNKWNNLLYDQKMQIDVKYDEIK